MAITFYCGSGSPYSWRVWLALEHKQLPYDLKMLSFQAGDLKQPAFLAVNPRGKVPAIVEDGFALWESAAILEYLDDRHPERPLFPSDPIARAVTRRLIHEADSYLGEAMERLVAQLLDRPAPNPEVLADATRVIDGELAHLERQLGDGRDWLVGELSAAELTIHPLIQLTRRLLARAHKELRPGPLAAAWQQRIEALPYYARTYPPHWK